MKKIICLALTLFTTACLYPAASAKTIVTYGGTFSPNNAGYQAFLSEHPDISLNWPDVVYYSSSAFTSALLTREFSCDMFTWPTDSMDWSVLMEKGYCLDLSGSKILADAVGRMHPYIAGQAMRDGRLYAIPDGCNFIFLQIDEDTWFEADLTLDDVPQSFPEFLDFLDRWCDRIQEEPEPEIRVLGGWEESPYSEASYVSWLTGHLVEEAVMQMQYAGETLHFDGQELQALLDRCDTVGRRIYQLESRRERACLFDESSRGVWPSSSAKIVYLRLNDAQPKLVKSVVSMWGVYASAGNPEACIELLEKVVRGPDAPDSAMEELLLYRDARAKFEPDYESNLAYWTGELNAVIEQLQDPELDGDARAVLEEARIRYQGAVELAEKNKWVMTPEQLADYQSAADRLYVTPPSFFDDSESAWVALDNLIDLFSNRHLTSEKFLEKLDRVAWMTRLEQ